MFAADEFNITYTHSVELCTCVDIYEINDGDLHLTGALTRSSGWGLPFKEEVVMTNGWFYYKMNRTFDHLQISTHQMNDYKLQFDGNSIDLSEYGDIVALKPKTS
ncbi:MAG: DUF1850 domain-containing protein [Halobacteriota archaeon]